MELEIVDLGLDELESLRLADQLGLPQAKAAKEMNISQPTFNRILSSARKKVADCLVSGKAIKIEEKEDTKNKKGKRGRLNESLYTDDGKRRNG